ncbi:MAG: hypothetical protein J7K00_03480 [Candidatus Diapherotrites archaeon]|nr:hypothetical protein [Candidatus Diapherotrites archaeon]
MLLIFLLGMFSSQSIFSLLKIPTQSAVESLGITEYFETTSDGCVAEFVNGPEETLEFSLKVINDAKEEIFIVQSYTEVEKEIKKEINTLLERGIITEKPKTPMGKIMMALERAGNGGVKIRAVIRDEPNNNDFILFLKKTGAEVKIYREHEVFWKEKQGTAHLHEKHLCNENFCVIGSANFLNSSQGFNDDSAYYTSCDYDEVMIDFNELWLKKSFFA